MVTAKSMRISGRKLLLIKPRVALRLVMKVGFSSHAVQQVCL